MKSDKAAERQRRDEIFQAVMERHRRERQLGPDVPYWVSALLIDSTDLLSIFGRGIVQSTLFATIATCLAWIFFLMNGYPLSGISFVFSIALALGLVANILTAPFLLIKKTNRKEPL